MACAWSVGVSFLGSRSSAHFVKGLSCVQVQWYSQKLRPLPPIDEVDIEETFVRGSGPGGQSINKTNISVSLLHKPTGIRVQCHQTRSREWNRSLARKILRERVDFAQNPGESKLESKWSIAAAKKAAQDRKRRRKIKKQEHEKIGSEQADSHSASPSSATSSAHGFPSLSYPKEAKKIQQPTAPIALIK